MESIAPMSSQYLLLQRQNSFLPLLPPPMIFLFYVETWYYMYLYARYYMHLRTYQMHRQLYLFPLCYPNPQHKATGN